jgi:hypothetical protein
LALNVSKSTSNTNLLVDKLTVELLTAHPIMKLISISYSKKTYQTHNTHFLLSISSTFLITAEFRKSLLPRFFP